MPEAVIVDAIRTPIGRAGRGSLKTVRADDLAATPIRALCHWRFASTKDSIAPGMSKVAAMRATSSSNAGSGAMSKIA